MNKYHLSLGSDFRCCLKPRGSRFSISQRYDIKKWLHGERKLTHAAVYFHYVGYNYYGSR